MAAADEVRVGRSIQRQIGNPPDGSVIFELVTRLPALSTYRRLSVARKKVVAFTTWDASSCQPIPVFRLFPPHPLIIIPLHLCPNHELLASTRAFCSTYARQGLRLLFAFGRATQQWPVQFSVKRSSRTHPRYHHITTLVIYTAIADLHLGSTFFVNYRRLVDDGVGSTC